MHDCRRPVKVLMVTGSYPPDVCGVGDYTYNLVQALQAQAIEVRVLASMAVEEGQIESSQPGQDHQDVPSWTPIRAIKVLKRAAGEFHPDIIHLQYPTIGFRYHLGPQAAVLYGAFTGRPLVVTVHESKQAHILRRISLLVFNAALHIIATTDAQASYLKKGLLYPSRARLSVIPIASNIPRVLADHSSVHLSCCTYFGLLYPNKGIDVFLEVARQARLIFDDKLRFRIVGKVHPDYSGYFGRLQDAAADLDVDWVMDRSPHEVARLLSESLVCILPYADGATYRRGTLLAAMLNGAPVITTRSSETPTDLVHGQNVYFARTVEDYIQGLHDLLNPAIYQRISANARRLAQQFDWSSIAIRHKDLYQRLLNVKKL